MTHLQSFIKLRTLILFSLFLLLFKFSYGQSSKSEKRKIDTIPNVQTAKPLPKLRFGAQVGYGYRFERGLYPHDSGYPAINDYSFKLKNGVSFGADLTYYFSKYMGAGIKYSGIYSQAKLSTAVFADAPENAFCAPISEKIDIHYIGIFYAARYFVIPHKHCILLNAGIGCIKYRNKMIYFTGFNGTFDETLDEATLAFSAEIGHDFLVTKSLAIGLQVSTVIDLLIKRINGSHIDVTLGLRFWK